MSIEEEYKKLSNPIMYYRILGPNHHVDLLGFHRSVNIFELMHLIKSEEKDRLEWREEFRKVDDDWVIDEAKRSERNIKLVKEVIPDQYVSYIPLRKLNNHAKPAKVISSKYPWKRLAKSIEKGFERPLVVEMSNRGFVIVEGKHRSAAATLIEPFNPDFLIPCLVVILDKEYTAKMWKQPHPFPFGGENSFKKFDRK